MDFIGYGIAAVLFFLGLWIGRRSERRIVQELKRFKEGYSDRLTGDMQAKYLPEEINTPLSQDMMVIAAETVVTSIDSIIGGIKSTVWTFGKGYSSGHGKSEDGEKDKPEEEK